MPDWFTGIIPLSLTATVYVIGIIIFLENRSPHRTMYWLLVLAFFPFFGLIFYILFGRNSKKYQFFSKMSHAEIPDLKEKNQNHPPALREFLEKMGFYDDKKRLTRLINAVTPSSMSFNNYCRILKNGEETFAAIFRAINSAKHHIHLEYFIVREGRIGNALKDLLIEKAQEGVEVRLLYDGVGSRKLRRKYIGELKEAGVKVASFLPFTLPVPSSWVNYRNHRKIAIVDGEVGFLGGVNIGDEYVDGGKKFPFWRDTHLEMKGDALDLLQGVFISDWSFTTKEEVRGKKYFPVRDKKGNHAVQIAASGPDGNWEAIHQAYFTAIATATKNIYLTTPYLIPDESILTALKSAALGGLDVSVVFPGTPDHRIVYWASNSYFTELLEAGVKIYLYQKGFVHAKTLTVDGQVAIIGTANMDMRSFYYSFEINAFIYDKLLAKRLEKDFKEDISYSIPVDLAAFNNRSLFKKIKESGARLFSPFF